MVATSQSSGRIIQSLVFTDRWWVEMLAPISRIPYGNVIQIIINRRVTLPAASMLVDVASLTISDSFELYEMLGSRFEICFDHLERLTAVPFLLVVRRAERAFLGSVRLYGLPSVQRPCYRILGSVTVTASLRRQRDESVVSAR
jgi:hypothetical protein